ncbi:30S ribosomal protein S16 [Candidatus Kaiserbacteria bacterium RIFCSPHIGHO2_12_FULL_53_13]|uniref:Small ribosomal subunit protein bS16 n=1 Tax=Candidatus Kaiserbacteria bacterium RIFCSPHIGHO2_12_FULL_53_13 TaxID=1798502 RepID=A0A1F6E6H4_9BACT|nr:MAG: 30S ribosomal protein S16 [Candidatus Kaiserbacteria bacterium RIFCSPHIGHO2_12_FULL_53_13]OGG74207.1 MAG: 30S ribosomal protein S16 [Candidatus Kaiserbacteria bacterium RIFCSPLOWO2_01_FULL_52_36]
MLKIRMQRIGRINMPAYRIIVAEHTRGPKTGNIVEKVGTYNPKSKERVLDAERIKYWLSVGAKASGTVHNMLISAGIITGKKINVLPKKHPPVVEKIEEKVAPEATPTAEPVAEEKKEEVAAEAVTQ